MEKHLLSKSTFIRGNQCLKSLYLNKKRPFLRDKMPKERLIVFQRGHKVGELAQDLFPGGINMSPGHPAAFKKAILNTANGIEEGVPVIYEAAFQFDQVLIFLDILVKEETGWHAYEVKSSAAISDTYLMDAALQYYVMHGFGLNLTGISIIHIDKEYILQDEIETDKLFNIVDVTAEALSRQAYVQEQIVREKEALSLAHSPKIPVGEHCRKPYDCDFIGHCWKNEPTPPEKGLPDQINATDYNKWVIDTDDLIFMKLLSMRPALPLYKGTRPYQEIIYGYSLGDKDKEVNQAVIRTHDQNPEPCILDELKARLTGKTKIICFGQAYIIRERFKENEVFDLQDLLSEDSDFYTKFKDRSELERLIKMFDLDKRIKMHAYRSSAIAAHYYLKEFEDPDVKKKITQYAETWSKLLILMHEYISGEM